MWPQIQRHCPGLAVKVMCNLNPGSGLYGHKPLCFGSFGQQKVGAEAVCVPSTRPQERLGVGWLRAEPKPWPLNSCSVFTKLVLKVLWIANTTQMNIYHFTFKPNDGVFKTTYYPSRNPNRNRFPVLYKLPAALISAGIDQQQNCRSGTKFQALFNIQDNSFNGYCLFL